MTSSQRAAVQNALQDLKPRLAAFLRKVLGSGAVSTGADVSALIDIAVKNWGMLRFHTERELQTYLHEVRHIRNRLAHDQPFPQGEARALDTIRLAKGLIEVDAPKESSPPPTAKLSAAPPRARNRRQVDVMRDIWRKFGPDEARVVREYADAERRGEVTRKSNIHNLSPEDYARALLADGQRKGWLTTAN